MAIGLSGNFVLKIKFGDTDIPFDPSAMPELSIIQDMNRFLPYLKLTMFDPTGVLTHRVPFDHSISKISIEIANSTSGEVNNKFNFSIYRRFPEGQFGTSNTYDIHGLLDVPNLFQPDFCRAWGTPVGIVAQDIAYNELGVDDIEISASLNKAVKVLQPNWTNAQLFRYWKRNLGDTVNYCYFPFIKVKEGFKIFSLMSLNELCSQQPSYKFAVNDVGFEDFKPVTGYSIYDNYKVVGVKGITNQYYTYFDNNACEQISVNDSYQNYISLTDYLEYDQSDSEGSQTMNDLGRTNEFTNDFMGKVRSRYYRRINDLVKMWIFTEGSMNVVPGDVVQMLFPQGLQAGDISTYQYSGNWLVERVVHSFGYSFSTKLLLTRGGLESDKFNSLVTTR